MTRTEGTEELRGALTALDLLLDSLSDAMIAQEDTVSEELRAVFLFRRIPDYIDALQYLSGQLSAAADRIERVYPGNRIA